MSYYLYTETAFHHQGDIDYMKKLIKASAEAGANGVKFQVLLDYDSLISKKHSMYHEFKRALISKEDWIDIFKYTNNKGLDIIFMPSCSSSLCLIENNEYKIKYIDIHSASFNDKKLMDIVKKTNKPVILGIGGREKIEIDEKIAFFGNQLAILMVGYQSFPSKIENLKIGKIKDLIESYPDCSIGYADHSSFDSEYAISSNEWAYILGAKFFEKHITIEEGVQRWDFQSAIGLEKMKILIDKLNFLDNEVFKYSKKELDIIEEPELTYRNRQKIATASSNLPKGHILEERDISFTMLDNSFGLTSSDVLIGRKLLNDIEEGEKISLENTF